MDRNECEIKGVVFGGDGSKCGGGSYGLTVLHCILQF
jgi:hypothetical protein